MFWGISLIEDIQARFQDYSGFMVFLSHVGDPRFAFTIYFPVAFVLHRSVGTRVLWAAVISEWLNAVLKWLLHGERPYWWVHHPGLYPENAVPQLKQFNITCETGPGSPSGHAMITSAVWYVLVSDFLHYRQIQSTVARLICWAVYLAVMCAVSVSRLFIATHFPHQVFAGILTGIFLGKAFNYVSTSSLRPVHYLVISATLAAVAALMYGLLLSAGVDPLWSVALATRWCAYREWIHLDTTLFYSLVRDVSSLAGLGLGIWLRPDQLTGMKGQPQSPVAAAVKIALALAVTLTSERFKPFHDNSTMFYTVGFVKHSLTVVCIVAGISVLYEGSVHVLNTQGVKS
ncbi:glucose-6-phosphatase [Plakobranchus ocellatus]|uniref:Glucose-6-phosphatase n=1 Tax=Plakobranchus ocellatus TaxID=259542 RepID=A0AAV3ZII4_9GAST|nr:glucose-6-phosphatase [Plakobranchus ocellatus]